MANKNNPFNKNTRVEQTDPVAQAQATYAEQQQTEQVPVNVVQEVEQVVDTKQETNTASSELTETSKDIANVTDTTKATSRELAESTILKTNSQEKARGNTVQRPTGASARESSPQNTQAKVTHTASADFSSLIAGEKVSGTAAAVGIISFMESYVKLMQPRRITTVAEIVRMQEGLYDQLMFVIERAPSKEFNRLWNIVIMFVNEYKSACFSPAYYNRGAREWKRDPQQFNVLSSLINLLVATANDRTIVNQVVNVDAVVGSGFTEDGRGRIYNFYSK